MHDQSFVASLSRPGHPKLQAQDLTFCGVQALGKPIGPQTIIVKGICLPQEGRRQQGT